MTTKAQLTPQVDVTVATKVRSSPFALETERARQWVAEHVMGETLYFGGNARPGENPRDVVAREDEEKKKWN
jgi:hypothetical protein